MKENSVMQNLPPYLFARIEKKIAEAREKGADIISLGIGDPDLPTPSHIVDVMKREISNTVNHQYPSSEGMLSFRKAVADWYKGRFNVDLDPRTEVVSLLGSKEGIAHISFAYIDPGDINLVPDPGYPVYHIGTLLAGGTTHFMPLKAENGFLPVLEDIPADAARKAKLIFANYPNNPTGAVADDDFYRRLIAFAREHDLLICHDAPYSEVSFDGLKSRSILEFEGAKDVAIEFHSLSKTYNMTGWRLGWACGNAAAIQVLSTLKSNIDSGVFQAIQYAGIEALTADQACVAQNTRIIQERRDIAVEGFRRMGWTVEPTKATFYMWMPVPAGYTSASFAEEVFEKSSVVITPGNGYGAEGEGYFRIALTVPADRLREAFDRMYNALGKIGPSAV